MPSKEQKKKDKREQNKEKRLADCLVPIPMHQLSGIQDNAMAADDGHNDTHENEMVGKLNLYRYGSSGNAAHWQEWNFTKPSRCKTEQRRADRIGCLASPPNAARYGGQRW